MKCSGDGRGSRSFTEPCLQHLQKKATEGRFIEQKIQTGEIDRDLEIIKLRVRVEIVKGEGNKGLVRAGK